METAAPRSGRRRGRRLVTGVVWRAGLLLLSCISAAIAVTQIKAAARLSVIVAGLDLLGSTNQAPSPEAAGAFAREHGLDRVGETCDPEVLSSVASFWRYIVASRTGDTPADLRAREILLRDANAHQQITCNPTNGIAWADSAEVARLRGAPITDIERRLALSRHYAPFEGEALGIRLETYPSLDEDDGNREMWLEDLRAELRFGSIDTAAWAVSTLPDDMRPIADRDVAALPQERRDAIVRAMEALAAGAE